MEGFPLPREAMKFAKKYFEQCYDGDVNAIVELGVHEGEHALNMYEMLKPKLFYLVDIYLDKFFDLITGEFMFKQDAEKIKRFAKEYLKDIPNHYFIEKWTHEAVISVPEQLDLVYIDASHDAFDVKRDIEMWWPKIRIGGIMCGHDFHTPSVENTVREIFPNIRFLPGEPIRQVNMKRYWNAEGKDWWLVKLSGNLKDTVSWMIESPETFLK